MGKFDKRPDLCYNKGILMLIGMIGGAYMKIVVAMDSFKGSLSAPAACEAVCRGFRSEVPGASFSLIPMADGGEGTVECIAAACGVDVSFETVPDLFGRSKECAYVLLDGGETAVIETAMAAGIADLKPNERDVLSASTYGVGMQMRNALQRGCKKIILGLGGSATTDCALGALQALGVEFFDSDGARIADGAGGGMLSRIAFADASRMISSEGVEFVYACDVTNPLYGRDGAAFVYAPQKGADEATVVDLDLGLRHFSAVLAQCFGRDISQVPGSGAAGGLCGGLLCGLGGTVRSGFEILSDAARLEEKIASADLVVTGEGKTDGQTAFGKLPCRIGETARKYAVPAIVVSGSVLPSATDLYDHGITALFDTVPSPATLENVMENAEKNLEFTARNVARTVSALALK